jgi:hypothetical protein
LDAIRGSEQGPGTGECGEVGTPHLDRHGAREEPGRPQSSSYLAGVALEDEAKFSWIDKIILERVLYGDGFALAFWLYRTVVTGKR